VLHKDDMKYARAYMQADVAVLEEPEHLTWYHHGTRWTDKFNHVVILLQHHHAAQPRCMFCCSGLLTSVPARISCIKQELLDAHCSWAQVGIMHTNYLDYARREEGGETKAKLLEAYNNWVCRVHCHKVPHSWRQISQAPSVLPPAAVIARCCSAVLSSECLPCWLSHDITLLFPQIVKLSDAVQPLPRQTTQFVHGVPKSFLAVGEAKAKPLEDGKPRFTRGAYFMGKVTA
jgi:digalactosyldiacylglycerol synthase